MRTFLAIPIPATEELRSIQQRLGRLRPALKLMPVDELHVTLVFLGETSDAIIPGLTQIVQKVASSMKSERVTLRGLGAFPDIARPTVIWAGFASSTLLPRLADDLGKRCESLGFVRELRPYRPHLTLARVKGPPSDALGDLILEHSATSFGSVTLSNVTLYRSDLGPAGPSYTSIASADLQ